MYKKRGNGTIWGIALFISFLVLIFVFVKFGDVDKILEENTTYNGNYYKPGTYSKSIQAANQLYTQMAGSYNLGCPQTDLTETTEGIIYVDKLQSSYNKTCMFVGNVYTSRFFNGVKQRTSMASGNTWSNPRIPLEVRSNYYETDNHNAMSNDEGLLYIDCLLDINMSVSDKMNSEDVKIFDLFCGTSVLTDTALPYIEIVSPFDFSFVNNNTDGESTPEKIIIISSSGDVKMTFDNCANWYCAGSKTDYIPSGEALENGNIADSSIPWQYHGRQKAEIVVGTKKDQFENDVEIKKDVSNPHCTIIGNSKNAYVHGGSYGKVIGYADDDTTVRIEVFENGEWRQITLQNWLTN